jgi:superfamily II DNA helicase RecQ
MNVRPSWHLCALNTRCDGLTDLFLTDDHAYVVQGHSDGSQKLELRLLYVTPERVAASPGLMSQVTSLIMNQVTNFNLAQLQLKNLDSKGLLSRFVVDEAHCLVSR